MKDWTPNVLVTNWHELRNMNHGLPRPTRKRWWQQRIRSRVHRHAMDTAIEPYLPFKLKHSLERLFLDTIPFFFFCKPCLCLQSRHSGSKPTALQALVSAQRCDQMSSTYGQKPFCWSSESRETQPRLLENRCSLLGLRGNPMHGFMTHETLIRALHEATWTRRGYSNSINCRVSANMYDYRLWYIIYKCVNTYFMTSRCFKTYFEWRCLRI